MSREQAPNYRLHECCFYCLHAEINTDRHREFPGYCTYHAFFFQDGEARARVCDDFDSWENEKEDKHGTSR